jgi:D-xylose transport system substrate-binding protein
MKKLRYYLELVLVIFLIMLIIQGCSRNNEDAKDDNIAEKKIQIGLSFDSYVIERWQRDKEVFVSTAQDLGAEVNVQNANGDVKEQISQIEYLIDKKMDVIVIIPVDWASLTDIIKRAKDSGIKVIAYDRLIKDANVDLYISFDNEQVGRLMAQALVNGIEEGGNIVTIFGPTTDYNVILVEQGFQEVIKEHKLNIVHSVYAKGWLAEEAYLAVNAALDITEEIDGVLCGNDNLASQAVLALSENRLAGKVIVTGQDADLAACQRIVEGTQTMTVYKPVDKLAKAAAEYAVRMARVENGDIIVSSSSINDGSYDVPFIKLEPIAVTKDNMREIIIEGGFQKEEDVYMNVPLADTAGNSEE